jgi:hypothetical protein
MSNLATLDGLGGLTQIGADISDIMITVDSNPVLRSTVALANPALTHSISISNNPALECAPDHWPPTDRDFRRIRAPDTMCYERYVSVERSRFVYIRDVNTPSQHPISMLTTPPDIDTHNIGLRCTAENSKFNPNQYRVNVIADVNATASSEASASNNASNANDKGDETGSELHTSWISENTDAQWIRFEMPSERVIFGVRILWSNHSSYYEIQVSRDGSSESWHAVATEFRAKEGEWKDTLFENRTSGKFWRVYSHTRSVHMTEHRYRNPRSRLTRLLDLRGTEFGIGIRDVKFFESTRTCIRTEAQLQRVLPCKSIDYFCLDDCVGCKQRTLDQLQLLEIRGKMPGLHYGSFSYRGSILLADSPQINSLVKPFAKLTGSLEGSLGIERMHNLTSLAGLESISSIGQGRGDAHVILDSNSILTSTLALASAAYDRSHLTVTNNPMLRCVPSDWPATTRAGTCCAGQNRTKSF